MEAKEKMHFVLYFPPVDDVQLLLGKQGFRMHRGFFRKQYEE